LLASFSEPTLSHLKNRKGFENRRTEYRGLSVARYSAASDITDGGIRVSQPSRNCLSQARSVTSWTARSAK
jgi:hypothetical protein